MSKTIPLDEQIIAALTQPCISGEAQRVLDAALAALRDLSSQADAADVASLNPLAAAREAMAHRARAGDLRFESDRLDASVSALRERVDELRDAEAGERQRADKAAVQVRFDALAADIAREYPAIVRRLTELAKRIHDNTVDCARVGFLSSAEIVGRGWSSRGLGDDFASLLDTQLPMPGNTSYRTAWGYTNAAMSNDRHWAGLDLPVDDAASQPVANGKVA